MSIVLKTERKFFQMKVKCIEIKKKYKCRIEVN